MYFSRQDILNLDHKKRLNIINSLSGIKSANLIGTVNQTKQTNLAIFNSLMHIGSNPPLIGFIMRPSTEVRRHTFENIIDSNQFTVNHVNSSILQNAHYTSAKFSADQSEFNECKLTEEYAYNFNAPFVKESIIKIGATLEEVLHIKSNDTRLIIGKVQHLVLPSHLISEKGYLNLEEADSVGVGGLNTYYQLKKTTTFPYARLTELPFFG
ncbi:MAG: flavin reductase family protein [Flavobacteriales bacterium]|jgi:flavin reductase (DIM6/NTAB) family NADH-FMN oxidoreductase RutF|nr:flavin reductase family protein [Flavobacteriales bacterium]